MNNYRFHVTTTMCDYNCDKWWIDRDYIKDIVIPAKTIDEAIETFYTHAEENYCINISSNAKKNKKSMYEDRKDGPIQVGYVVIASSDFEQERPIHKWVKQYIQLWIKITLEIDAFNNKEVL